MKSFRTKVLGKAVIFMLVLLLLPIDSFFEPVSTKAETMDSAPSYMAYNSLSAAQKAIYCAVLTEMMNPESEFVKVDLSTFNVTIDTLRQGGFFEDVIFGLSRDFPRYSWFYSYGTSASYYGDKVKTVTISIPYYGPFTSWKEITKYLSEENNAAQRVANGIPSSAKTRYERVKYVNDYLVKNVSYNNNAAEALYCGNQDSFYYSWTAYGALVDKSCVCEGYAKAFKLILDYLGIPCQLIEGYAGGGSHMWTQVQMEDGKWYAVDPTWNDPVYSGTPSQSQIERDMSAYLLIGEKTLSRDHTADTNASYQKLSSTDYDPLNAVAEPLKIYNQPLHRRTDSEKDDFSYYGDSFGTDVVAVEPSLGEIAEVLYAGESQNLIINNLPSDAKVTYKSSKKSIAKVSSSGKITAVKKGSATITAIVKTGTKTYTFKKKITVKTPYIELSRNVTALKKGKSATLTATVYGVADKAISATTSDSSVARVTVLDDGRIKITGKRKGTATITISCGKAKTSFEIKIK